MDRVAGGRTTATPRLDDRERAARAVWKVVSECQAQVSGGFTRYDFRRVMARLGKWFFRSRLYARAYWKPQGYAGDYRMMEWMYDLEEHPGDDPTQSAICNCLDYAFSTAHNVRAVWERRWWFRDLLLEEYERTRGTLCVLDIACGGARYQRDFLSRLPSTEGVSLTLADQDVAALAFCEQEALAPWMHRIRTIGQPIKHLPASLGDETFDLIIATGIYDYFDMDTARQVTAHLTSRLRPRGTLALSNFHPDDPSRFMRELLGDWYLLVKTEEQLRSLFPSSVVVETSRSEDGSLGYARARVPSGGVTGSRAE